MQRDPIAAKCSELMRLGLMPLASEIKAGKVRCDDPHHSHDRSLTAITGPAYDRYFQSQGKRPRRTLKTLLGYEQTYMARRFRGQMGRRSMARVTLGVPFTVRDILRCFDIGAYWGPTAYVCHVFPCCTPYMPRRLAAQALLSIVYYADPNGIFDFIRRDQKTVSTSFPQASKEMI
jgi:hypothetical protein